MPVTFLFVLFTYSTVLILPIAVTLYTAFVFVSVTLSPFLIFLAERILLSSSALGILVGFSKFSDVPAGFIVGVTFGFAVGVIFVLAVDKELGVIVGETLGFAVGIMPGLTIR